MLVNPGPMKADSEPSLALLPKFGPILVEVEPSEVEFGRQYWSMLAKLVKCGRFRANRG